jgi:Glycoside hydrolase family 44
MRAKSVLLVAATGALGFVGLLPMVFSALPVTGLEPQSEKPSTTTARARAGSFVLQCTTPGYPISPLIYGVANDGNKAIWAMGATARRWGGNPTSRYNWELNTWSLTKDWFFRNAGNAKGSYDDFLRENQQNNVKTALTVPMLGWVAKDASSYSFPVSIFGPQEATAGDGPDAGNGVGRDGKPITPGPQTRTSVRSTPESIERWVREIRMKDRSRGRTVDSYILDNEPMLWNSTHRDVHPEPTTYDELLEKTVAYATAIRRADPDAKIAGPAEWGWLAYQYSAKDITDGGVGLRPDRRAHGDIPLIPWYLRKTREYQQKTGIKILDILDVHFYSMANGVGIGTGGQTDALTAALRIRTTRSLWDPTYLDESWINERMRVLPLLHQWIAENAPGLGLSIGEWNFGAESHMSGGLATAEALGRFGTEAVTSAYYWTSPPENSPSYWAFRAFRNFDAMRGRFLDWSVPVRSETALASLFGSRDAERRHIVAVLLNHAAFSSLSAHVVLDGCGSPRSARAFTYTGGAEGFWPLAVTANTPTLDVSAPPYSINVIDVTVDPLSR